VESAVLDDHLLMEDKKFLSIKDKLVTFKWVILILKTVTHSKRH
jgi:hypothetical protein